MKRWDLLRGMSRVALGPALLTIVGCGEAEPSEAEHIDVTREPVVLRGDFQDATGTILMRVKTCDWTPSGTDNCAYCFVDDGWSRVGGGAEIEGEATPGAMLKASFPAQFTYTRANSNGCSGEAGPVDGAFWVAKSSGPTHRLRAYIVGMQVRNSPTGTGFSNGSSPSIDKVSNVTSVAGTVSNFVSEDATDLLHGVVVPGQFLIGGGAEIVPNDGSTGDAFLTESFPVKASDNLNNTWRASARVHVPPAGGIGVKPYGLAMDSCPTGWSSCLERPSIRNVTGTATSGYRTVRETTPAPFVPTASGAQALQGTAGAGRYLADLIPLDGANPGFTVRAKSADSGGTTNAAMLGSALAIRPLPPTTTITVGTGCSFEQALATVNAGAAVGSCAAPSGNDLIRLPARAAAYVVAATDLEIRRKVTIAGGGSATTTLQFGGVVGGNGDSGLRVVNGSRVVIDSVTLRGVDGNQLSGVHVVDGVLGLTDARVTNFGYAGVHNQEAGTVMIVGSTIDRDGIFGSLPLGGGILNFGRMDIQASTIANNFAADGGGIANLAGLLTVNASTFEGNEALFTGGGLHDENGAIITNSTFTANSTTGSQSGVGGGAIYTTAELTLTHDTIARNDTSGVGGGIYIAATADFPSRLQRCIIAQNSADGDGEDIFGPINTDSTLASNLIGDPSGLSPAVTCEPASACTDPDVCFLPLCGDPQLGALASVNSRPRSFGLLGGSRAIDAWSQGSRRSQNDERGTPRPSAGGFDLGAVEELNPNLSLFGFETLSQWTSPAPLSLDSVHKTEGLVGLGVGGSGYRVVTSGPLRTPPTPSPAALRLDIFVPSGQPNPAWLGAVQTYASCPSAGMNNTFIGQVDLTGKPTNAFSTLVFALPAQVASAFSQVHTDCFVSVSVNMNATPVPPVLDNLRFTP